MSALSIQVENLSKLYQLGQIGTGTLSKDLQRWWAHSRGKEDPFAKIGQVNDRAVKASSDFVWALRDIAFNVKQGEVLGIIGRNGAGKSTLLKVLSKITSPTTGKVHLNGRIASLLEVGTGFHPEMTGRENIYMNGAILGMRKWEIIKKFDAIVDFAGVQAYIDTPVKRYSSGMYVRLAFAVAAFLEPEILIVDEVLAVGDAEFQKKCLGRMKDVSVNDGRTVLFVSHNMTSIQNLCETALWLDKGMVNRTGPVNDIIRAYLDSGSTDTEWEGVDGDAEIAILRTYIRGTQSNSEVFANNEELEIGIDIECRAQYQSLVIGFNVLSMYDAPILRANYNDFNDINGLHRGRHLLRFRVPPYFLATGAYKLIFDVAIPHLKKLSSEQINLSFEIRAANETGNRYMTENYPTYNSVVRPNLFKGIEAVGSLQ
jgi:lipopolysaccharide transport system ATP-binding protein